ncbi:MAG: hypothetical protein CMO81_01875 [Waddliaceae bacterium]|nr:hypothetical protein [Waddliaceae bacterium]
MELNTSTDTISPNLFDNYSEKDIKEWIINDDSDKFKVFIETIKNQPKLFDALSDKNFDHLSFWEFTIVSAASSCLKVLEEFLDEKFLTSGDFLYSGDFLLNALKPPSHEEASSEFTKSFFKITENSPEKCQKLLETLETILGKNDLSYLLLKLEQYTHFTKSAIKWNEFEQILPFISACPIVLCIGEKDSNYAFEAILDPVINKNFSEKKSLEFLKTLKEQYPSYFTEASSYGISLMKCLELKKEENLLNTYLETIGKTREWLDTCAQSKLLGHNFSMKGKATIDGTIVDLEGWKKELAFDKISKSFIEFSKEKNTSKLNVVIDALNNVSLMQNDYKIWPRISSGKLSICSIVQSDIAHAVSIVIQGKNVIVCNRSNGKGKFTGWTLLKLKNEMTLEQIRMYASPTEAQWNDIATQLNADIVYSYEQSPQRTGNCTWASLKSAIHAAIFLQYYLDGFEDKPHEAAKKVTLFMREWRKYDRINSLKEYRKDPHASLLLIKNIESKIIYKALKQELKKMNSKGCINPKLFSTLKKYAKPINAFSYEGDQKIPVPKNLWETAHKELSCRSTSFHEFRCDFIREISHASDEMRSLIRKTVDEYHLDNWAVYDPMDIG